MATKTTNPSRGEGPVSQFTERGKPYTTADGVVHERKPRWRRLLHQKAAEERRSEFLKGLEQGRSVAEMVAVLKLPEQVVYKWRTEDKKFKAKMEEVLAQREEIARVLRVPEVEDKLYQMALKKTGNVTAALAYLVAHYPAKYGKTRVEVSGTVDSRIAFIRWEELSKEEQAKVLGR